MPVDGPENQPWGTPSFFIKKLIDKIGLKFLKFRGLTSFLFSDDKSYENPFK